MRKTLITITMGLALLPQMSKAQVYDEESLNRSSTTGCSITTTPIMSGNGSGTDCSIADSI